MKRIIYCVVITLLACVSVNAQNVEAAITEEMNVATENLAAEAVVEAVEDAVVGESVISQEVAAELARPTLLNHSMVADYVTNKADDYKNSPDWRHAKGLRTAGIITTSVGGAMALIFGISAVEEANKDNLGGLFGGMLSTTAAIAGGAAAIAGGVMWIVGNSKMKKARLAYTGNGLAYTF